MSDSTSGYVFPAWFVNAIMASILSALIGIGYYMWQWNIGDSQIKATLVEQVGSLKVLTDSINKKVDKTLIDTPVIDQKVSDLDRRISRLEDRAERGIR